ncbi:MAG TPA: helix-turn-helix domain-containing protein [Acidimicrobiales bacterium]|nr:helix-turn-helix domain-containing protein [Acidimicrobiales bacterium]
MKDLPDRFVDLGAFIREQRNSARLSLRRLSELAGISNPYLSQIERGLRRPSAEILQQIAKALRISAETLYVQAGILDQPDGDTDLSRHIFADHHLTEEQRQALLRIYLSFRHENEASTNVPEQSAPAGSSSADPPAPEPMASPEPPHASAPGSSTSVRSAPSSTSTSAPSPGSGASGGDGPAAGRARRPAVASREP